MIRGTKIEWKNKIIKEKSFHLQLISSLILPINVEYKKVKKLIFTFFIRMHVQCFMIFISNELLINFSCVAFWYSEKFIQSHCEV